MLLIDSNEPNPDYINIFKQSPVSTEVYDCQGNFWSVSIKEENSLENKCKQKCAYKM